MIYSGIERLLGIALALTLGIIVDKITNKNQRFPRLILLLIGGFLLNEFIGIPLGGRFIEKDDLEFVALILELALSVVLFKEGLELDLVAVKKFIGSILLLATVGVVVSTVISATFLYLITPLTFYLAILISGTLAPTDPAATFSLFKGGLRIKAKEKNIIGGESALNDAVAIVLVTTVFLKSAINNELALDAHVLIDLSTSFFGGIFLGYVLGRLFLKINSKLDHHSQTNMISLSLVLLTFVLSTYLRELGVEISAPITSLTAGIVFGNPQFFKIDRFSQEHLHEFQSNISELGELLAFVTIGMLFTPTDDILLSAGMGILIGVLAIVSRTISIAILRFPTNISLKESFFIAMGGMRGLATGVLAVLVLPHIGPILTERITESVFIDAILFGLITTAAIQGLTIKYIGRKTSSIIIADKRKELRIDRRVITSRISFYKRMLDQGEITKTRYEDMTIPLYDKLTLIRRSIEKERKDDLERFGDLIEEFEMATSVLRDLISYKIELSSETNRNTEVVDEKIKELEEVEEELTKKLLVEIDVLHIKRDYINETQDKASGQVHDLILEVHNKICGLNDKYKTNSCEKLSDKIHQIAGDVHDLIES